ncbi:MAG: T9SS type A sorting domain-containing protein, partial [Bacteroidota bacterium]
GADGAAGTNGNLTLIYSLGEPIISTPQINSTGGLQASEGFLQPLPLLAAPLSDSIWPGDANNDGIADQYDLLTLGIGYGSTGPSRPNASLNWTAQWAPDWTDSLLSNVNYKHLDCNGDGIINADDTLAINLNFGLTHNKTDHLDPRGLPLTLTIEEDSVGVGDTLNMIIELGNDTMPATDVYGLAFSVNLDTSVFQLPTARVNYSNSWFGLKNVDMITLDKSLEAEQQLVVAMVGTDQNDRQGFGRVGKISIIMIDDLAGKRDLFELIKPSLGEARLINAKGELVKLNTFSQDSAVLFERTLGLDSQLDLGVQIYPNPSDDMVQIKMDRQMASGYQLRTLHGQLIKQSDQAFREAVIPLEGLAKGWYLLQVRVGERIYSERILFQ